MPGCQAPRGAAIVQPVHIRSDIPARLDRLPWTSWHWRIVVALGVAWVLDGLEVTIVGSLGGVLERADTLALTATQIGWAGSLYVGGAVIGASGAVFTVMVVYALNWPHRQILIWGLLPVPVWGFVAFSVLGNVLGLIGAGEGSATSFLAHLGGAAFGWLWFRKGDVLQRVAQRRRQAAAGRALAASDLDRREMDRILAKIQASGLSSLDGHERAFLERRSRQLRDQGR